MASKLSFTSAAKKQQSISVSIDLGVSGKAGANTEEKEGTKPAPLPAAKKSPKNATKFKLSISTHKSPTRGMKSPTRGLKTEVKSPTKNLFIAMSPKSPKGFGQNNFTVQAAKSPPKTSVKKQAVKK